MSECYKICNNRYGITDAGRTFCKKGCDSDEEDIEKCKAETCTSLCIKSELGEDEKNNLGTWSKWLARAPKDSGFCLSACYFGCNNKEDGDDDDKKE
mmetsp:Transcript_66209/g.76852  ORF Transcript_66209/g.76852 Transcript_66209/m.76852 type:complete len:97 (-) Transcript_66209:181-471(-)